MPLPKQYICIQVALSFLINWSFFLIKLSNIQYSQVFHSVIFEIDCMFKNKYEIKMIQTGTCESPVHFNISPAPGFIPVFLRGPCCSSLYFSVLCFFSNVACLSGVTNGAGTAYPSGAHESTSSFQWSSCSSIFSLICMCFVNRCLSFCTCLFAIVLSVLLRCTNSD